MKIAIGSDHAGFSLKTEIINHLKEISFEDLGTFSEAPCDYPDYISQVALKVKENNPSLGIVICGSGVGASMVANKVKGIRAALCFNEEMAEMAKRHNNANILALGARIIQKETALAMIKKWLSAPFEGGRHQDRLQKIKLLEDSSFK